MKCIQLSLFALFVALPVGRVASASAFYEARTSGLLEIVSIGTQSVFEGDGSISVRVPGFTITVDDLFQTPVLQEPYTHETDGYGDFFSGASSSAQLNANDPFDIGVADSLSIIVGASGRASDTKRSFASSSAVKEAKLYLVNDSDHEVAVDTRWHYSATSYAEYSGPDGEDAYASVDLAPFIGDLGITPITYWVDPNTVEELSLLATAEGYAFTPRAVPQPEPIPEPTSLVVWIMLGLPATIVVLRRLGA